MVTQMQQELDEVKAFSDHCRELCASESFVARLGGREVLRGTSVGAATPGADHRCYPVASGAEPSGKWRGTPGAS